MADIAWFESAPAVKRAARVPATRGPAARSRKVRRHRTIFISDTHLGTRHCKADVLADFLAHNESETLFLVGDIVDGWQLKRWYWTSAQDRVVAEILRKVDEGTRVIFVPGNHDEFARDYCGRLFGGIEIMHEAIHVTADGLRLWVLHGDRFDTVVRNAKWLAHLGDWAYGVALRANDWLLAARKAMGLPHWSLSAWLKHKVKNAAQFITRFEEIVAREAESQGVDGVMCGHIHHAEIRCIGGVLYLNDGDWVESCTALVEDAHGKMEILHWASHPQRNTVGAQATASGAAAEAALIPA
ncbi:MAG: UDP-2,3-diacylglucosamine diphosphatase [Alphaproteobacteria bacterium]|nr:UDP-2,3-diacylglucosamine diphosphatase [Alphaproteobacteria bacterium]